MFEQVHMLAELVRHLTHPLFRWVGVAYQLDRWGAETTSYPKSVTSDYYARSLQTTYIKPVV